MDVKTTFLYVDLEDHIVMQHPEGFGVGLRGENVFLLAQVPLWSQAVTKTVVFEIR